LGYRLTLPEEFPTSALSSKNKALGKALPRLPFYPWLGGSAWRSLADEHQHSNTKLSTNTTTTNTNNTKLDFALPKIFSLRHQHFNDTVSSR